MTEKPAHPKPVSKHGSLVFPCATVFISSFCIMVLEIVAGRLIARFLGSSLYTWTSVIGVVLAGITLGNYLGGHIADRFPSRKALSILFALASIACVSTVILNNIVALWIWLWQFSWPFRVFSHVTIVFLIPSVLLGTISPVVAKMALDKGLPTGRTVGDIYAWGAAGSIVGTFVAGYYLIATLGTIAIIWIVAGVLLLMSILYWAQLKVLYAAALILILAMVTGLGPWAWAKKTGATLALRQRPDTSVIYETESQYSYIQVRQVSEQPPQRVFLQDKLVHSRIDMDEPSNLKYHYEQVYAAVTHRFSRGKEDLAFLTLGGGGYVFPSYISRHWPGSRNDVVEIDPAVTEAALKIFYPREDPSIRTISMDARNYIDGLVEDQKIGKKSVTYDFIYEDALNNYAVPYQLTTREFNEKLLQVLKDDGIYLVELIDNYESGLFVGAFVNTLELTFDHVYVISKRDEQALEARQTFVVIASRHPLNLENLNDDYHGEVSIWLLNENEVDYLKNKAQNLVLTDDYAPVENLLAPVVRKEATEAMEKRKEVFARQENITRARKVVARIEELALKGNADQVIESLKNVEPSISSYCVKMLAAKLKEQAANPNDETYTPIPALADVYYNLGISLMKSGQRNEGLVQMHLAELSYRQQLAEDPDSELAHSHLAAILFLMGGDSEQIIYHFQRAVELNPASAQNHVNLIMALEGAGKIDEAISAAETSMKYMQNSGQNQAASQLLQYLQRLHYKKIQSQQKQ